MKGSYIVTCINLATVCMIYAEIHAKMRCISGRQEEVNTQILTIYITNLTKTYQIFYVFLTTENRSKFIWQQVARVLTIKPILQGCKILSLQKIGQFWQRQRADFCPISDRSFTVLTNSCKSFGKSIPILGSASS